MKTNKQKIRILYFFPGPIYRPDLADFRSRFEILSDEFEGEVYSWTCDRQYSTYEMGSFLFRGLVSRRKGILKRVVLACHILRLAYHFHRQKKVDIIICYDPMYTGVLGALLKIILKCKLIVEVNSFKIGGSPVDEFGSIWRNARRMFMRMLSYFSIQIADAVKVLTCESQKLIAKKFKNKRIFSFHSFVPVEYFLKEAKRSEKYILFIGFPFYLKGVDVLIKAFQKVSNDFPDFHLKLIGHLLENEAQKKLGQWDGEKIHFIKAMPYNEELRDYFLNCYCFVLPSRDEAFGRVLVEAMSSGKPLIGSCVGGISTLIEDGKNGFLFESENVEMLASKLRILLSDSKMAAKMGERSLALINQKFSTQKYYEHFKRMIDEVLLNG